MKVRTNEMRKEECNAEKSRLRINATNSRLRVRKSKPGNNKNSRNLTMYERILPLRTLECAPFLIRSPCLYWNSFPYVFQDETLLEHTRACWVYFLSSISFADFGTKSWLDAPTNEAYGQLRFSAFESNICWSEILFRVPILDFSYKPSFAVYPPSFPLLQQKSNV